LAAKHAYSGAVDLRYIFFREMQALVLTTSPAMYQIATES